MEAYLINLAIYQALLLPIIFFSILYYVLGFTTLFISMPRYRFPKIRDEDLPSVTVQIPVYNDPVAIRCVKKCLQFNYPKNKYDIIMADDSTDEITKNIIDDFAGRHASVRVVRRGGRKGYKPGALNYILPQTKGDIICLFDSDFVPKKNFLRKLVAPFVQDENVAVVQSRMSFTNYNTNIISKFAGTLLIMYHNCIMPIGSKLNAIFFCGTGGAIRKDILLKAGGWNDKSITEDADLSVVLLEKGYKHVYMHNLTCAGEVPFTLKSFLVQQTRWAYGMTRIFVERWKTIFFSKNFTLSQKGMITYITTGYVVAPIVVLVAITGQLGWILTPPKPFLISDILNFMLMFAYTSGFIFLGVIGIKRDGKIGDFFKLLLAAFTIGIVLAFTNMIAFFKAVLGMKSGWIRTPKMANLSILQFFRKLFGRQEK